MFAKLERLTDRVIAQRWNDRAVGRLADESFGSDANNDRRESAAADEDEDEG